MRHIVVLLFLLRPVPMLGESVGSAGLVGFSVSGLSPAIGGCAELRYAAREQLREQVGAVHSR